MLVWLSVYANHPWSVTHRRSKLYRMSWTYSLTGECRLYYELFVKATAATTLTGLWVGVVKIFLCVLQKYQHVSE